MQETQKPEETKTADFSRKFNLKFGYQDKQDEKLIHREVVISRRPTGADFIKAAESGSDIQFNLGLIGSAISVFGSLPMPVSLTWLLSLNEIDHNKLNEEFLLFIIATRASQEAQILEDKRAQLSFGIERDGVTYNVIKFGRLLNGYDQIEIQDEAQSAWHSRALKIAREVVEISTIDGSKFAAGSLTLAEIEAMDATDFLVLQEAESQWLDSFRD